MLRLGGQYTVTGFLRWAYRGTSRRQHPGEPEQGNPKSATLEVESHTRRSLTDQSVDWSRFHGLTVRACLPVTETDSKRRT